MPKSLSFHIKRMPATLLEQKYSSGNDNWHWHSILRYTTDITISTSSSHASS
jgi:hypothetical protein